MALKKSVLKGLLAFAVATLVVRKLGREGLATKIGLLAGGSVVLSSWLSGDEVDTEIEFEDEASIAE